MLRGFIFDLDGVITDTAQLHYRAWQALAHRYGMFFDSALNERLKGVSRIESLRLILDGRSVADTEFERMLVEKNTAYVESLNDLSVSDILPGIVDLLDSLRSGQRKLAVASASKNARTILDRLALRGSFDAISDGNSVQNSKPAPDVFVHAAGQMGLDCVECVVFEDAVAGVEGAKAAGMKTIGIGNHVATARPDVLFATTHEMKFEKLQASLGL